MADPIDEGPGPGAPPATPAPVATPAPPAPPAVAEVSVQEVDLGRRRFFRQFAGDIIQTAATMAGAAQALQRASAEAAGALLDPDGGGAFAGLQAEFAGEPAPRGFRTPFREDGGVLYLIDQRHLPDSLVEYDCRSAGEVAFAIREMIVRGAPAIGQVAAIGLALTAAKCAESRPYARRATLLGGANALRLSRPTAINLAWAVDRLIARYMAIGDLSEDGAAIAAAMREEANTIVFEATSDHSRLASIGYEVLPPRTDVPLRILTHCNTGPLACGMFGTALGVVQIAHNAERPIHVWVDETRPYLQGARLTAWELAQAGVPHTLIPDVAAGHLMSRGEVDVILVGADRVAANGDTANKVGTYTLAVLAERHGVPFYVCAPTSSIDLATPDGAGIPIEERKAEEVLSFRGVRIAPPETDVRNPAFDVTPAELITGIVTEEGVIRGPFGPGLADAVANANARRAASISPFRAVPAAELATPVDGPG